MPLTVATSEGTGFPLQPVDLLPTENDRQLAGEAACLLTFTCSLTLQPEKLLRNIFLHPLLRNTQQNSFNFLSL